MANLRSTEDYGRITGRFTGVPDDGTPTSVGLDGYVVFTPDKTSVSIRDFDGGTSILSIQSVTVEIKDGSLYGPQGQDYVSLLASDGPNLSASVLWTANINITGPVIITKKPEPYSFLIEVRSGKTDTIVDVIKQSSRVHNVSLINNSLQSAVDEFNSRVLSGEFNGPEGPPGPRGVTGAGVQGGVGPSGEKGDTGDPGEGGNAIPDGDLEDDTFFRGGDYVWNYGKAASGRYYASVKSAVSRRIYLPIEKSYTLSLYTRSASIKDLNLTIRYYDSLGKITKTDKRVISVSESSWRKKTIDFTTMVGYNSIDLFLEVDASSIDVDFFTLYDITQFQVIRDQIKASNVELQQAIDGLRVDSAEAKEQQDQLDGALNDLSVALEAVGDLDGVDEKINKALEGINEKIDGIGTKEDFDQLKSELASANSKAQAAQDLAQAATDAASAATQAALQAAGIADAKGRVIYSESEPPESDRSTSNLWVKPSDASTWVWSPDDNRWLEVEDKDIQSAAQNAASANEKAVAANATAEDAKASAESAKTKADQVAADLTTAKSDLSNQIITSANGKTRNTVSVDAPSSTTPGNVAGDTWWKKKSSTDSTITGQWSWDGSSWVSSPAGSEIIANLDVGKLVASTANIESAVVDKMWANIFVAKKVSATEINAQSIAAATAEFQKVTASNIVAGTGQFDSAVVNKIWAEVVTAKKISASEIVVGGLPSSALADSAVTAVKIADGAITADKILAGSITSDLISANGITADKVQGGSFVGERFSGGLFEGATFRTSDPKPGAVTVSETAFGGRPGISIEPTDSASYSGFPGIGPDTLGGGDTSGITISGGSYKTGSRSGFNATPELAQLHWGDYSSESGPSTWVTLGRSDASITYQPSRNTSAARSEIKVNTDGCSIYRADADGATGLVSASPKRAQVSARSPSGLTRFLADEKELYLLREKRLNGKTLTQDIFAFDDDGLTYKQAAWDTSGNKLYSRWTKFGDTGWISVDASSNVNVAAGLAYRIVNSVCYWRGIIYGKGGGGVLSSGLTLYCIAPAAARPVTSYLRGAATNDAVHIFLQIQPDGRMEVYASANTNGWIHTSPLAYPLG